MENKFEGMMFIQKKKVIRKAAAGDVSITHQPKNDRICIAFRDGLSTLIADAQHPYIRVGVMKNRIYFVPTSDDEAGYFLSAYKNQEDVKRISFSAVGVLPTFKKFMGVRDLKFDKVKELYFVQAVEEE